MPILNYTTTVATDRTVAKIQKLLARAGAASVATHYNDDGEPIGIAFSLNTPHGSRQFEMPVNISGVDQVLIKDPAVRRANKRYIQPEHAAKVAWRVVEEWLDAQLAIIEANMVTLDQVMLPYLVVRPDGTTLYQQYRASEQSAIESGVTQ